MRGIGRINFINVLQAITMGVLFGDIGIMMGGGNFISKIVSWILRPMIGPMIQRMLGGFQGALGTVGAAA
jgi:hypothetical protein